MKSSRLAATCAAATLVFAGSTLSDSLFSGSLVARAMPAQAQPREIAFESAGDFLNLPADTYFGEVAGVATTSTGNIWVYTQSGGPNATVGASRVYINGGPRLFEFDKAGKFLREIGTKDDSRPYNFLFAQGVRVDPQNNIWVVDRASRMVVKFDQSGRVLLTLGRRPEAIGEIGSSAGSGVYGRGSGPPGSGVPGDNFNQPTDVAWDAAGNIFVPDGYANARVAKFDKTGKFIKSWGSTGAEPGQFNIPHSVAVDAKGNVYVADMGNQRIQVFDNDGTFKTRDQERGRPPGHLHLARRAPVPLQLQLQPDRGPLPQRGDLQDGAGRHGAGTYRPRRQAAQGVRHGQRNRLPRSQHLVRRRAHELASAEAHPALTSRRARQHRNGVDPGYKRRGSTHERKRSE